MKHFVVFFEILFWTLAFASSSGALEKNGLVNFLSSAMANYSTWLTENDLDPSPPFPNLINLVSKDGGISRVKLNCQLGNFHISGHSNKSVESSIVDGNLEEGYFRIDRHEEIKYSGNYTAEGTFSDPNGQIRHFGGSGPFLVTYKGPVHSILHFENFQISDDGYIDLSVPPGTLDYVFNSNIDEFSFAGLWDEDWANFGKYIYLEVRHLFGDYAYAYAEEDLPSPQLLVEYLKEIFSKTPVSDIVLWP